MLTWVPGTITKQHHKGNSWVDNLFLTFFCTCYKNKISLIVMKWISVHNLGTQFKHHLVKMWFENSCILIRNWVNKKKKKKVACNCWRYTAVHFTARQLHCPDSWNLAIDYTLRPVWSQGEHFLYLYLLVCQYLPTRIYHLIFSTEYTKCMLNLGSDAKSTMQSEWCKV